MPGNFVGQKSRLLTAIDADNELRRNRAELDTVVNDLPLPHPDSICRAARGSFHEPDADAPRGRPSRYQDCDTSNLGRGVQVEDDYDRQYAARRRAGATWVSLKSRTLGGISVQCGGQKVLTCGLERELIDARTCC